jgi:hypothetical protein
MLRALGFDQKLSDLTISQLPVEVGSREQSRCAQDPVGGD